MEMPDATILLGLLPRVESKVRIRALSAPAISSEWLHSAQNVGRQRAALALL